MRNPKVIVTFFECCSVIMICKFNLWVFELKSFSSPIVRLKSLSVLLTPAIYGSKLMKRLSLNPKSLPFGGTLIEMSVMRLVALLKKKSFLGKRYLENKYHRGSRSHQRQHMSGRRCCWSCCLAPSPYTWDWSECCWLMDSWHWCKCHSKEWNHRRTPRLSHILLTSHLVVDFVREGCIEVDCKIGEGGLGHVELRYSWMAKRLPALMFGRLKETINKRKKMSSCTFLEPLSIRLYYLNSQANKSFIGVKVSQGYLLFVVIITKARAS